ncbi:MAG: aminotransferase class I/II-fold pyridoxal phosphate-dependent enzyme [Planctomycetota bacterium]|jgi:aspartate/methionine/tyrosine aminotransferase
MAIVVNKNILEMEYAVRGPIPARAAEMKREGRAIIPCNIGNPQALGQNPISYYRQVLSLAEDPSRIARERVINRSARPVEGLKETDYVSDYVLDLTEDFLVKMETGLGAYTESSGPRFIREAVAQFIDKRDGGQVPSDPDKIFVTNGASEGAKYVIDLLIASKTDGIMIPIPQYPLYSATIRKCGGVQVNYYPDEDSGWTFDRSILDRAYDAAVADGVDVKGIVAINPGNPTGAILDEKSVREVIDFADEKGLVIIADEVYQENVYGAEFVSFAKVLGERDVPLVSLHSISKGFYGECGHRGGYLEVRNPPKVAGTDLDFVQVIVKLASVSLCSNTAGQLLVYLMVSPPREGTEPHARFAAERESVLKGLFEKATMIREGFEKMDSVECFGRTGAMYLFPRLNKLPAGKTDFDYCMSLLEETGLTTVNGSGFGQKESTHHLRIAFLPPKDLLDRVLPEWIDFHNEYVKG